MNPLPLMACLAILTATSIARAEAAPEFPPASQLPSVKELPDPLRNFDGSQVTTPAEWAKRRDEIRAIVSYYAVGHAPPPPGNVEGKVLKSAPVLGGKVSYQLIRLSFGPDHSLSLKVALYVPQEVKGPISTIVFPAFTATPGDDPPDHPDPKYRATSPEEFAQIRSDALGQGYAILTYFYQEAAADRANNKDTGFFPAYPGYDWATLREWAWGISRCVDYLEAQPFVDKSRIMLVGHSRLGKATLVAGAFDDRISLVVPAGSGCGGTGAYRVNGKARTGKEGLEEMTAHFPQWLNPRITQFDGQVDKLPFDENCLMALVAPRPLLMTEGFDDAACNGKASVASFLGTRGTYHFLGVDDRLGIHFRPGKHALTDDDWATILDFANHELRGAPAQHDFHTVPDASQLH